MRAVTMFDLDGDEAVAKLVKDLQRRGVRVLLAVVSSDQLELMEKTGTLDLIGSRNIYRTVRAAASAAQPGREIDDSAPEG
jgi:MFS superfamily sulfate permease-like transporter